MGYTGANCEISIPPCFSSPCANNGTCTSTNNFYSCTCAPGYTGQRCTSRLIACSSTPCENGGTCIENVLHFLEISF